MSSTKLPSTAQTTNSSALEQVRARLAAEPAWPGAVEYQEALQHPQAVFAHPELKHATVATNKLGLPRVAAGAFAVVYELETATTTHAVRCFLRPVTDQQARYAAISAHLEEIELPALVGFEYQPEGILSGGAWRPLVCMDWVRGKTLDSFLDERRAPETLQKLARRWRGVVNGLRGSRIAHGDLQQGNVLVTEGDELVLVDYDAMFVPALRGRQAPELGHPNFQHPGRTAAHYDEKLDTFSALVIYLSLRALAADSSLWERFNTGTNLLFSRDDFLAPTHSAVFAALDTSPDPGVRQLSVQLAHFCAAPIESLPEFEETLAALPPLPDLDAAPETDTAAQALTALEENAFWGRVAQKQGAPQELPPEEVVEEALATETPLQASNAVADRISQQIVGAVLVIAFLLISLQSCTPQPRAPGVPPYYVNDSTTSRTAPWTREGASAIQQPGSFTGLR